MRSEFSEVFPVLVEAYTRGKFVLAAGLTFFINFFLGSPVYITFPSLVFPFGGVATGCIRAVGWGLVLAPYSPELAEAMIPHLLTLILEGQDYILAMFAAYIQWKGVLRPKSVGEENRVQSFKAGLRKTANM